MYKQGAALNLVREAEKYKIRCIALQEVRWEDAGSSKISQTTIINGSSEQGHRLGTGFAIHESIIHTVKDFRDISPRISTLTLRTNDFRIVLINAHAPTKEKDDEEKEEFYSTLEDVMDTSVGDVKIVLGDFNAKIGKEALYRAVAGAHSLHEITNNNGMKLINFAIGKGLFIKSTMFPRKEIHKYTWISPDGKHKNQIDHVLVNGRFKNGITNVRTLRGADSDSDHLLVGFWIRVKLKKHNKCNTTSMRRYNVEKLEDKKTLRDYNSTVKKIFEEKLIEHTNDVNEIWNKVKDTIEAAATRVIGTKRNMSKFWFNNICEEAVQRRKAAREEWLKDTNNETKRTRFITR